ncbi:alpha-mannosidase [Anabaena cylindrica FACHB-243]|uniref:Alpha-mannosidase n=1 Tax=Anabaena cylindrica (strain ATCC 27899 / PCC 7122) TaxID=272123 RepID=K9ZGI6_ANACC|nr:MULTISPECIES: alpha-mannosidase [Anabaena]AFZ57864.1 Alpha-mannosidase [Anabaena cylindrica PCC 7122]MBD2419781.1 alpha-mannosidase [Anabaena cylindrica FACHB-243]MBY5281515.1 alpha-mannosidase [Anabaena sp. CCAP 1446/1C]MBY5307231.1 alpha-mannosidase [Anabaena sp. CCAP 1446/1C]MCM2405595.1 alpha-mannosidase [Anabaena sp. CCAP 1446/1C]
MTLPVYPFDTKSISEAIEKLRACCQVNIQSCWFYQQVDWGIDEVMNSDWSVWQPVKLNDKAYVAWTGGKQVLWLVQKLVVPQDLQGYDLAGLSLRLALVWWADAAEIYVNGKLVLAGDLFDCSPRVLLSQGVKVGDEFFIALRLVSPGHCDGALVRSLFVYESINYDRLDPGFLADELAVVEVFLEGFAPDRLSVLVEAVEEVLNHEDAKDAKEEEKKEEWERVLLSLRQQLIKSKIQSLKSKIHLLGHAHLDLAWLWPVSETWNAAVSTFESALSLQADFPELVFCHSTPALYAWVEEHRPDLFAKIQVQVKAGKWEVLGGFWVEPELNLISGESIVRQLLYGQRYFQEKFGKVSPVVWVPDTFGFCATLPQFFANAGVEFFVTQKLRWNDTTKFDYGAFWWRSLDGSQIFSFMSAPIGETIDPVKMAQYACEWESQTGLHDSLWLPGVGDHGGGPTRDMLEIARRWQYSPVFPQLEFTSAENYLQLIKSQSQNLPVWEDELYLEFHRGCYTTHADQKRWNRKSENLLYEAELFATLANVVCGVTYPKSDIETAWKQVLFNQFHDILPGSSITQVYEDALPEWQQVEQVGKKILDQSLRAIASHINLSQPPQPNSIPIIIFNSLNWQRSEVVSVTLPTIAADQTWKIYDIDGNQLASQESENSLLFLATVPSVGYNIYWLSPSSHFPTSPPHNPEWILENQYLRVEVNPETGDLASVFNKIQNREFLSGAGNQLQAFQDGGQYWDAWNIDPNYREHPLPPTQLKSIQWLENGEIQQRLRVVRQLGKSEFCQDYILQVASPLLKISNTVNWQENQVLVKTAFPLNLEADFATYEIPCGAIRRSTNPQTPAEKAKWEVPALRWADLTTSSSTDKYGVSLLNDCKYGYDTKTSQLRLTLLRSSNWPDSQADRGTHEFTYSLYPHLESWEEADTVKHGYELNIPLQVLVNPENIQSALNFSQNQSFLNLSGENLILIALKPSEDNLHKFIMRFYECHGKTGNLSLESDLFTLDEAVDLLEKPINQEVDKIAPWKIATFVVIPKT